MYVIILVLVETLWRWMLNLLLLRNAVSIEVRCKVSASERKLEFNLSNSICQFSETVPIRFKMYILVLKKFIFKYVNVHNFFSKTKLK